MKDFNNRIVDLHTNIMKRLLIAIGIVLIGIFVWITTSRRCGRKSERTKIETPVAIQCKEDEQTTDNECQHDSRTAPSEPVATVSASKRSIVNKGEVTFKNITLRGFWKDRGDESDTSMLIRYINNIRVDSAAIVGSCDGIRSDNQFCRLMWGIDSRTIDITKKLNKTIDMRFLGVVPGCKFYSYRFDSWFNIHIALPEPAPDWILNTISETVQPIVNAYDEDAAKDSIVLKHDGNSNFLDRMLRCYYKGFRKRYSRQKAKEGDAFCGIYLCQYYIYPVWGDETGSRITYRTYEFQNMGGAHGGYSDYYSTYDSATGRLLGIKELLSEREMDKAFEQLEKDWYCYKTEWQGITEFDPDGRCNADFGENDFSADTFEAQIYKGKAYPRPALTRHGVVFSYQMYTKGGCTAEGVRHFVVPYNKLK